MIDPDTGNYTVGELEAAAAAAKQRVKDAKKAEAAKAKEDAKARLSAFEDARGKVNEKAKAFAKDGTTDNFVAMEATIAPLLAAARAILPVTTIKAD